MKSILFLQNLGAGEIIIIVLVFFFIFFIVRSINSATDERKGNWDRCPDCARRMQEEV